MLNQFIPDLSVRSSLKEIMDDPVCDPVQLIRTVRQFKVDQYIG